MLSSKMRKSPKKGMEQKRVLISINVVGSAGPIRYIVNEDDIVSDVVGMALKIYSRQGRLPVLGFDANDFNLLCPTADLDSDVLSPLVRIGSIGARNYLLCKKPMLKKGADDIKKDAVLMKNAGKETGGLKTWINRSLRVMISAQ